MYLSCNLINLNWPVQQIKHQFFLMDRYKNVLRGATLVLLNVNVDFKAN